LHKQFIFDTKPISQHRIYKTYISNPFYKLYIIIVSYNFTFWLEEILIFFFWLIEIEIYLLLTLITNR